ncbi:MAG: twitching motility protein PilT [Methanobacteriales archaeon Met13]
MTTTQFQVDVVVELKTILPSYNLYVPSFVVEELEHIKKKSRGKAKIAASVALKIAQSPPFMVKHMEIGKKERVDDALLRLSSVLCTNDRELKQKAREKGIPVVYLRQKRYLSVEGHLNSP